MDFEHCLIRFAYIVRPVHCLHVQPARHYKNPHRKLHFDSYYHYPIAIISKQTGHSLPFSCPFSIFQDPEAISSY